MSAEELYSAVPDELVFELTGFRPEQMNERESAIVRKRASKRWHELCAIAEKHSVDDFVMSTQDHPDGPITLGMLRREAGLHSMDDQTHE